MERTAHWRQRALAHVADLGGTNPGRMISALADRPYATTEDMGMLQAREITGRGRFRLWAAG